MNATDVYTLGTVPAISIVFMIISLAIAVGLPIALFIYSRKRIGARALPFFVGCLTFYLVARVIEPRILAGIIDGTGTLLTGNIIVFAVFGGLAAAFFEEFGRLLAMRYIIRQLDTRDAFMYGVGHGGIEAIMLIGAIMFGNILNSMLINNGIMAESLASLDAETAAKTFEAIAPLWQTAPGLFLCAGLERLFAIILHICLSIIIFYYYDTKDKKFLYTALFVHFIVDAIAVVLGNTVSIYLTELVVGIMTAALVMHTFKTVKAMEAEPAESEE